MLCQFSFKNFMSYKDETVLDLQAVSTQGFNNSLLKNDNDNRPFLPVAVIFGPNAGGKSNVIKALNCVCSRILRPVYLMKNNGNTHSVSAKCVPFLFDDDSKNSPTEFELFFRPDNEYEYKYFISYLEDTINEEYLYRKKIGAKGYPATIFERDKNEIKVGSSIYKTCINTEINDQMPYLSFLAVNYKIEPIQTAIKWFEKRIMRNYANPFAENKLVIGEGDKFKQKLLTLLNDAGIEISNFEFVEKSDDKKAYDIIFYHTVNGKSYPLNITDESDGTQKLFNVLPLVIITISEGSLLILDELDAKLHPKLLRFIIRLFKSPDINKKGAQLIFTSHDISSMKSTVFRTDEIWYACKNDDQSSILYSLYELRDENNNRISSSAAFDKQYLEGRYGADPCFHSMMKWE